MKEIDVFNYKKEDVSNIIYDFPVKLLIKKDSYVKAKNELRVKKQTSTIAFENVKFNSEVSINVDEEIEDDISISFHHCFIDSFSDFALVSKKLSLYFGSCVVSNLRTQSGNLKSIQINNSFGKYFIEKTKNVSFSYTEENIFPKKWIVSIRTNEQLNNLISYKTIIHLTDIENINVYGHEIEEQRKNELIKERKLKTLGRYKNFTINHQDHKRYRLRRVLSKKEKALLNFNLTLNYSAEFNHQKTIVRNLPLNSISFNGKAKGEISIEDCRIDNVYIRKFSPKTDFTLYNIEPRTKEKGKFEVNNSNLDNTWFNAVNLRSYFIVFHKSSFINTRFSSTLFPTIKELLNSNSFSSVKNIHYPNEKPNKGLFSRNMYELFLELKQAFERRGNTFEAQKMKAVAHSYLLKSKGLRFWSDRFVLGTSKLTNSHGISVRNAFIWILIFVTLFHCLNILSFNSIEFGYDNWEEYKKIICDNFKYLFAIANPTHKISSLAPESEITGYTYMFSFLSRICIGYLYYQFIVAFRRFGK